MRLLDYFRKNLGIKLIWVIVVSSILLNLDATRYELTSNYNLIDHPFYGIFLSPFSDVRYGHYVARKFFLVLVALFVFVYWAAKQKNILRLLRANLVYIIFIGSFLLLLRILTYDFWFYNDDLRFFQFHLFAPTQENFNPQASWGPIGLHPVAMFLLVIRWFGTDYFLYNSLGLLFYFLSSVAIFTLSRKLQLGKFVATAAAIFFLSSPTYFQGRLLIGEVINSPISLLLVLLSILMLLNRFLPGSLIFAAAALEYGVAKTYFIALPLTLFVLFLLPKRSSLLQILKERRLVAFIISIWLMSLVYLQTFARAPSSSGKSLGIDQLYVFGDVLSSVTVPLWVSYPLVHLLNLVLNGWIYITFGLGMLVLVFFVLSWLFFIVRKQTVGSRLVLIGLSIILPTVAVGSYMGVRVDHNVAKLVSYQLTGQIPGGATGYGFFPTLGLTFILLGFATVVKRKGFRVLLAILILFNTIISVSSDYKWRNSQYSLVQRRYNEQLEKILPRDGIDRYIFIPSKERVFFENVRNFGSVYQGNHGFFVFLDAKDFAKALEDKGDKNVHIYFLSSKVGSDYKIDDYSDKIRSTSFSNLPKVIEQVSLSLGL